MKIAKTFSMLLVLNLALVPVFSQEIETLVSKYTGKNGEAYLQPLADATGAIFNTGFYHSAKLKSNGFQLYLGVVTTAAFIPEKNKTFTATTDGFFSPEQSAEAPTVFGPAQSVEVEGDGGTVYVFPAGLNVKMVPFAIPQLSVGSVFGTDATVRFFTYQLEDDLGKIDLLSIGIRHSVSQYVPLLPVDLAAGFYYTSFGIGDFIKSNSWIISAQASKRISIFTFYGGLGFENTSLDIDYHNDEEDIDVVFNMKGGNSIRLTAGLTFNLGPVKLNVDYNLASQSVLSAGIGVGIGE